MSRSFAVFAVAALVAACTPESRRPDNANQVRFSDTWTIEANTSRLTDKVDVSVRTISTNVRSLARSTGARIAVLGVACDRVLVVYGSPIGGPGNAFVSVRADQKAARNDLFNVEPHLETISATGPKARTAISYMLDADNLYIQVTSATIGITSVDMKIVGLRDAMRAANMPCL